MNNFKKVSSALALVLAVAFSVVAYDATSASLGTVEVVPDGDLPIFSLEEQMSSDYAIKLRKKKTTKKNNTEEEELEIDI